MLEIDPKSLQKPTKTNLIKNSGSYILLGMALLAMAFFGVCSPNGGGVNSLSGDAAVVDGEGISGKSFRRTYSRLYDQYQSQQGSNFNPQAMRLAQSVLDQLVDDRVNYSFARSLGLNASDNEVLKVLGEAEVFKDEKGVFSAEKFNNFLRREGFSEAELKEEIRRSQALGKLRNFVLTSIYVSDKTAKIDALLAKYSVNIAYITLDASTVKPSVTPEEVQNFLKTPENEVRLKTYFDANKSDYMKPEMAEARHILIGFKGARNAAGDAQNRSKEDARKKIETILNETKASGADFAALAKKYTDEPSGKTSGGSLGQFKHEDMVKEFSDAAFALNPGAISGVVESPFGFHIIKLEKKIPAIDTPFEQAKNEIAEKLLLQDKQPKFLDTVAEEIKGVLSDEAKLNEALAKYSLNWQETGEFNPSTSSFIKGLGNDESVTNTIISMQKVGEINPDIVSSGSKKIILKLKSRKLPVETEISQEEIKQSSQSLSFRTGYQLYNELEKRQRKTYEDSGKIWLNPSFLKLDIKEEGTGEGS